MVIKGAISINNIAKAITEELEAYADLANVELEEIGEEVAKEGVALLKIHSPKRFGKYAGSWKVKKDGKKVVIHNKDHYRLTHLLERGHVKADGGRTAPQPHIKPVEEKLIKKYMSEVQKRLST